MDKSSQKAPTKIATDKPPTTGTYSPLKKLAPLEQPKPRKKAKASKTDCGVTTLTEGDLTDIENTIQDNTWEAVNEAMSK